MLLFPKTPLVEEVPEKGLLPLPPGSVVELPFGLVVPGVTVVLLPEPLEKIKKQQHIKENIRQVTTTLRH